MCDVELTKVWPILAVNYSDTQIFVTSRLIVFSNTLGNSWINLKKLLCKTLNVECGGRSEKRTYAKWYYSFKI